MTQALFAIKGQHATSHESIFNYMPPEDSVIHLEWSFHGRLCLSHPIHLPPNLPCALYTSATITFWKKLFQALSYSRSLAQTFPPWRTLPSIRAWLDHSHPSHLSLNVTSGNCLVAQWLRIRLPMQGTRVWALVREDPTCCGATKPVGHNYWACTLEPMSHNYWALMPQLLKPMRLEPVLCNKRSHCNEKPTHRNEEKPPLTATRESPSIATKTQCSQN